MDWPTISDDPVVQRHYEEMRMAGESHNLSEMLALRAPPMSNTDREFLQGHVNGNQFEGSEDIGDQYKREAEAAGVSTTGKVYLGGLAAFPGDPKAWVAGRGDFQKVVEERGWGCEGAVNVTAPQKAPIPDIDVADDILDREVGEIVAAHPEGERIDKTDLKEQVREKRKPHWAKK
jgi:hypothetical protein